ncbi:hypothetical protein HYX12_04850 [Candidatus Woesearchaeota archaeon]|nr:hypothetical protein [Candidatus Woesearchaeota archaeon]
MALELHLAQRQVQQQDQPEEGAKAYNIVSLSPVSNFPPQEKDVSLYLIPANLSDVIAYAEAPTLEEAVGKLFQEAIDRLEEDEKNIADFLGWPAYFTSVAMVETGGDNFFGYKPFVVYPVPLKTVLQFAQLYTERVEPVKRKEQEEQSKELRKRYEEEEKKKRHFSGFF